MFLNSNCYCCAGHYAGGKYCNGGFYRHSALLALLFIVCLLLLQCIPGAVVECCIILNPPLQAVTAPGDVYRVASCSHLYLRPAAAFAVARFGRQLMQAVHAQS